MKETESSLGWDGVIWPWGNGTEREKAGFVRSELVFGLVGGFLGQIALLLLRYVYLSCCRYFGVLGCL
jgi:hypothetical protein